jgi:hypothetical protein
MGSPFFTSAPGQVFLISRSLEPIPLPSLVHRGRIVILLSYCLFSVLILAVRPVCLRFCASLWSHYKKQLL